MIDKKIFELHADVCKALGNPLRIEVIDILQDKEFCFSDILEITGGLKSNLSQHLSLMTKKGILKVRKDGQCNYYSLSSKKVAKACNLMREVLIENLKKNQKVLEKL
ncbi:MAG: winged helix-turn-helix transcriptional regulator [Bacteroidetes bacterium]|nr:winged helix-turn-helix transcriptional regulator [Bacteroidota bacterium]HET6246009.1 metalloregulator ArsR/SmtB family transcription factor [Bacteroidia bacterium]